MNRLFLGKRGTAALMGALLLVGSVLSAVTLPAAGLVVRAETASITVSVDDNTKEALDFGDDAIQIGSVGMKKDGGTVSVTKSDSYTFTFKIGFGFALSSITINGTAYTPSSQEGTVTVSGVPHANSYSISSTRSESSDVTIMWGYDADDVPEEAYVDPATGTISFVSLKRGGTTYKDLKDLGPSKVDDKGGYIAAKRNDEVVLKLVPKGGYQIQGASINGQAVTANNDQSEFTVTMTTNFHLAGAFKKTDAQTSLSGNTTVVTGFPAVTGTDASVTTGNVAVAATGGQTNPEEDSVKTAMGADSGDYVATVETLDITMKNIVAKGDDVDYATNSGSYWDAGNLSTLSNEATLYLNVTNDLADGETYGVVREHSGSLKELDSAVYNSTTGQLRFSSNQFSKYTIIKKKGTPETTPTAVVSGGGAKAAVTEPAEPAPLPENDHVNFLGKNYGTTLPGHYYAWSVPGFAVMAPEATAQKEAGLAANEGLFVTTWDITQKSAPLALASLKAGAASVGATLGATLQINVNKMSGGRLVSLEGNPLTVRTTMAIPVAFRREDAKYAVICVKSGGAYEILPDLDEDPATVTFMARAGNGAYAIIRY